MRFTVEMIVPREVGDDLGNTAVAAETLLRYELELGYTASAQSDAPGRLVLIKEAQVRATIPLPPARGEFVESLRLLPDGTLLEDTGAVGGASQLRSTVRSAVVGAEGFAGRRHGESAAPPVELSC
jgi:hypothetical protein